MRLIENLSIISIENFLTQQRNWDVFISCTSFEERCLRSSNIFLDKKVKFETSIVFNYKENDPGNKKEENKKRMVDNLSKLSNFVYIFDTESVSFPSEGIKKFLNFLKEKDISILNKNVIVDITVFTKPYYFLFFKVMKEIFSLCKFHVIYTEPEEYTRKRSNINEIILTEGLDRIESIPSFGGSSADRKDALIIIMGFEGKRSIEVFSSIDPELTYAVNGFPSFQPGWHRMSMEANLRFLKESGACDHLFFAPAVDPFETRKVVSNIVNEIENKNQNLNLVIAPLGTKMQAFGVLLYALQNKKVKVIYPFPSVYQPDYSYKYGPTWIIKVDLDKLMKG